MGNHLRLVVRITNLLLYDRFIRSVTGLIARHVTGRERGRGRDRDTGKSSVPLELRVCLNLSHFSFMPIKPR